ncbi:MAG: hypothetical protein ACO4B6_10830, partial [Ilumatobacteraceae bacterium]
MSEPTVSESLGVPFLDAAAATCRFAERGRVPARLVAPGQLQCGSPLPAAAGYVAVEVSMNGQDFSADGSSF